MDFWNDDDNDLSFLSTLDSSVPTETGYRPINYHLIKAIKILSLYLHPCLLYILFYTSYEAVSNIVAQYHFSHKAVTIIVAKYRFKNFLLTSMPESKSNVVTVANKTMIRIFVVFLAVLANW